MAEQLGKIGENSQHNVASDHHGSYRVSHVIIDLDWVELDLIFLLVAQLPSRQIQADSGTLKIQVNQTQFTSIWDTVYILC